MFNRQQENNNGKDNNNKNLRISETAVLLLRLPF